MTYDLVLAAAWWVVVAAVIIATRGHFSRQPLRRRWLEKGYAQYGSWLITPLVAH